MKTSERALREPHARHPTYVAKYAQASKRLLEEALAQGALVIGEVVYAELASQFLMLGGGDRHPAAYLKRLPSGGLCANRRRIGCLLVS